MRKCRWNGAEPAAAELPRLCSEAQQTGLLVVRFAESSSGSALDWDLLELWTRSRAVTAADVSGALAGSALEVALTCDLVYLRSGVVLHLGETHEVPSAGLIWALGRAGRGALARGLLDGGELEAAEAVRLGLATAVLEPEAPLPVAGSHSVTALTAARDLMRARQAGDCGLALERATFQLLFAAGDPNEGARAFLERREPVFPGDTD